MTTTAAHLEAENLTAGHQSVAVFSGVDLNLAPGTIHGIIGPNGAGKSTLLSALGAMHPATSGAVRVAGHPRRPECQGKSPSAGARSAGPGFRE